LQFFQAGESPAEIGCQHGVHRLEGFFTALLSHGKHVRIRSMKSGVSED
jgi:hypothetical protein